MAAPRTLAVLVGAALLVFVAAYGVAALTARPDPAPPRDPIVLTTPGPAGSSPATSPPARTRDPGPTPGSSPRSGLACDDDPDDDEDGVVVVRPCPEDIGDDDDDDALTDDTDDRDDPGHGGDRDEG